LTENRKRTTDNGQQTTNNKQNCTFVNSNICRMKRLITVLAAVLIMAAAHAQEKKVYQYDYIVRVGDSAPDFTITEAGGRTYKLSDLRGKVVMLQFTASWCSVCRKEMPFIESEIWLPGKVKGLSVIGIDRDEPEEKVLKFKDDMKITYPLALDPGAEIFALYSLKESGVTRNVIIDRKGKIIYLTRLFERDEFDKMKEIIFSELAKK
jgi:peroxiredoxin